MQRLAFGAGGDGLVAIGAFAGANNDHVLLAAQAGRSLRMDGALSSIRSASDRLGRLLMELPRTRPHVFHAFSS
jgi:hypothetical protein